MTPTPVNSLDQIYSALAEATARVGEANAPLFLAVLSLSLMARQSDTDTAEALTLIAQAERLAGT